MSINMFSSVICLIAMLCFIKAQPLYSSGLSHEENIQELRIIQSNMETQITKILKKEISSIKEQDMNFLQILEKMQTELRKLENRVTNVTKDQDSALLLIEERMQTGLTTLENKVTNVTKEEDMKLLQIMEKMQTELSKLENRVTNVTKDQDSELLQIREKMQTELSKLENKITNVTKEQDSKLLQIEERMQTEITKLENRVTNVSKGIFLPQILERMQTKLLKLDNKVGNITKDMSPKSCPSNWVSFGSSCYKIIAKKKSWDKAVIRCLQYGAKLAEVETKEENYFLKQRITNYDKSRLYWIGGTDEIREGRFVWASTGNSLTFTDWNRGEPNNDESKEDCIEISGHSDRRGMWNDSDCSFEFYFICEKTL